MSKSNFNRGLETSGMTYDKENIHNNIPVNKPFTNNENKKKKGRPIGQRQKKQNDEPSPLVGSFLDLENKIGPKE